MIDNSEDKISRFCKFHELSKELSERCNDINEFKTRYVINFYKL